MREIKFRGKRIDTGEWIYGYFTRNDENGNCYITTQTKSGGAHPWRVRSETVGQFTGLHDKNGKEIYEGDILRCKCHDKKNSVYSFSGDVIKYKFVDSAVEWFSSFSNHGYRLINFKNRSMQMMIKPSALSNMEAEIIGSIHDQKAEA